MSVWINRLAVQETVTKMGWFIDRGDWDGLAEVFADSVRLDYSSLYGGEPHAVAGSDLVTRMRNFAGSLDALQHLVSGVLTSVDGDTATATANVVAVHSLATRFGSPLWTIAGTYDFGLTRTTGNTWRIDSLKLTILWADGNQHIRPAPPARES